MKDFKERGVQNATTRAIKAELGFSNHADPPAVRAILSDASVSEIRKQCIEGECLPFVRAASQRFVTV